MDAQGRIAVRPKGAAGPAVALPEVVDAAMAQGAKLPMLVRFPDVLGDRLRKLQAAQYVANHDGEVCPAKWKEGQKTLKPSLDLVGKI